MDVAFLLDKYFKAAKNVSIDVFDAQTLNAVYKDIVRTRCLTLCDLSFTQERIS